jgi:flagellar motor switch protein FliN/FliY
MTTTESTLSRIVGDTAAAILPAETSWTILEASRDDAMPPNGARAVGCRAGEHIIVLVVDPEMARRVQVGPPQTEEFLDGFAPVVQAIASVLGAGTPEPLTEISPSDAIAELPDHAVCTAMQDGELHLVGILITPPSPDGTKDPEAAQFAPINPGGALPGQSSGLEVLHEVRMGVTAELGRTTMVLRDILQLGPGAVIELDRAASAPVDVMVNGTLIARGEVVVIDEEFGIRITEVVGYEPPRSRLHVAEAP